LKQTSKIVFLRLCFLQEGHSTVSLSIEKTIFQIAFRISRKQTQTMAFYFPVTFYVYFMTFNIAVVQRFYDFIGVSFGTSTKEYLSRISMLPTISPFNPVLLQ
jgi:hypothetical protein